MGSGEGEWEWEGSWSKLESRVTKEVRIINM